MNAQRPTRRVRHAYALALLLAFGGHGLAQDGSDFRLQQLVEQARTAELYKHPTWQRLLHYQRVAPQRYRSTVLTERFFNSPAGSTSPAAELDATLQAFYAPLPDAPDEHAQCRFPARLFWLRKALDVPPGLLPEVACAQLATWAGFERLKSVSVIFVSGYFGNPASSFGHLLLKLNNSRDTSRSGLYDQGINFGALVPDGENPAVYVWRGLFGGYQAGFSDRKFYLQDLVYSKTELRDMWEYELALSASETRLLVYHLWEQSGLLYDYYFLDDNCALQIAELLELAIDTEFVSDRPLWVTPVSVFHKLHAVDEQRNGQLLRQIRFLPSAQRTLQARFARLSEAERQTANAFIRDPDQDLHPLLEPFSVPGKIAIGKALLAYHVLTALP